MTGGEFAGKVAVVTGGASGMGREVVAQLTAQGAKVGVFDRSAEKADDAERLARPVDVTDDEQVGAAFADVVAVWGAPDIVVHAAGVAGGVTPITEFDPAVCRTVLDVNVVGTMLVAKHAGRVMGRGGVIINVASTAATQPAPGMTAYCASKAAVSIVTRVSALDLAPRGIRVLEVAPGLTETPMTAAGVFGVQETLDSILAEIPLGRAGTPADIAGVVLFLAGPAAAWMTGSTVSVDGGQLLRSFPYRRQLAAPAAGE